ncbi:leucine-rich repeat domain-containing protein [Flammeovirga aprica]|uniref:Leucine-rich repeat protein n=1 Tax=Flammeovirga aprica JL-4 TaxID=694437 RepID=A0A7X9XA73_9BACT|nr:leucine-rich repeat domain-containing protein [Flammeovirga aprica]NME69344.1 leucine-rich repeat protein [Flammeovirga aprica JL-4]
MKLHFYSFIYLLLLQFTCFGQSSYTLTDDDVIVQNNVLQSVNYDFSIKKIIIPDRLDGQIIKQIADKSFSGTGVFEKQGITSIQLPSQLEYIGTSAFSENDLTNVNLPQSLIQIADSVFFNNQIQEVNLNEGLEKIGRHAFQDNKIKELDLPSSLLFIYQFGFHNNEIEKIDFSEAKLKDIYSSVFSKNKLKEVYLPEIVEGVSFEAFAENYIQTLTFKGSVSQIGERAFYHNDITKIEFGGSFFRIIKNAFRGNPNLKSITLPKNPHPGFLYYEAYNSDVGYKENFFEDQHYTKFDCTIEAMITYPLDESLYTVENGVITDLNVDRLYRLHIPDTINGQEIIGLKDHVFNKKRLIAVKLPSKLQFIGRNTFQDNDLTFISIPASVDSIAEDVFEDNNIDSLHFEGNNLEYIGREAFAQNAIANLHLPSGVQYISSGAFRSNQIKELTLPENLKRIESSTFSGNNISEITLPTGLESLESWCFAYNKISEVTLPETLKKYDYSVFYNNNIQYVLLPQSTSPDFLGWYNLRTNNLHDTDSAFVTDEFSFEKVIKYILKEEDVIIEDSTIVGLKDPYFNKKYFIIPHKLGDHTIHSVEKLFSNQSYGYPIYKLSIEEGIEKISKTSFSEKYLYEVDFPTSLKVIEDCSFRSNKLTQLDLPLSLISLEDFLFANNLLTKVVLNDSLTNIERNAFYNNQIDTIVFNQKLKTIEEGAFTRNNPINISLPSSIEQVGEDAFTYSDSIQLLLPISQFDNAVEWEVYKRYNYDEREMQEGFFPENTLIEYQGQNIYLQRRILLEGISQQIYSPEDIRYRISFPYKEKHITFPYRVDHLDLNIDSISIFQNNFYKDDVIRSIIFEEGIKEIGSNNFQHLQLIDILLPQSLKAIQSGAFSNNNLNEVSLPDSVEFIGSGAFHNNNLKSFKLPNTQGDDFEYWIDDKGNYYDKNEEVFNLLSAYYCVFTGDRAPGKPTSIEDQKLDLIIFPNPTDGQFSIKGLTKESNLSIYSLEGKMLYSKLHSPLENEVQFSGIPGIYYLVIKNDSQLKTIKILKK